MDSITKFEEEEKTKTPAPSDTQGKDLLSKFTPIRKKIVREGKKPLYFEGFHFEGAEPLTMETYSQIVILIEEKLKTETISAQFMKEVEKLKKDPRYTEKGAEMDRPYFDFEDEEKTILADTFHNFTLLLAFVRANAPTITEKPYYVFGPEKGLKVSVQLLSIIGYFLTSKSIINKGPQIIHPYTRGKDKEIKIYVEVTIPENSKIEGAIEGKENLTEQEMDVLNAASSIFFSDNWHFKLGMLNRALSTTERKTRLSQRRREELLKIIHTLGRTEITIDAREEFEKLGLKGYGPMKDTLLNVREILPTEENGPKEPIFIFNNEPILLTYARLTGWIKTFKPEDLKVHKELKEVMELEIYPKGTSRVNPKDTTEKKPEKKYEPTGQKRLTLERISIRNNLLKRYGQMIDKDGYLRGKQNTSIRFDTLFQKAGIVINNRTMLKKYNDFTIDLIKQHVKEGKTHGHDYKTVTEGRGGKIIGVEILVPKRPRKKAKPNKATKTKEEAKK